MKKLFMLIGMAVGAVFGVLFAPKKGAETRKNLQKEWEKGGYGADTLKKTATKIGEDLSQTSREVYKSDSFKKGKETVAKATKDAYGKVVDKAKELKSRLKEEAKEELDD